MEILMADPYPRHFRNRRRKILDGNELGAEESAAVLFWVVKCPVRESETGAVAVPRKFRNGDTSFHRC